MGKKMDFLFENTFISAGAPKKLEPYIHFEQIWPKESIERHSEILKLYSERKERYKILENCSRQKIENWKLERIKNLVQYAYNNFKFYRELFDRINFNPFEMKSMKEFEKIPIISKEGLTQIYKETQKNRWYTVKHESRTSGSTGKPLSIINDIDAHRFWYVQRLQMFEHMLGEPLKPTDWIYNIYYEPFLLSSIFGKYRVFTVGLGASDEDIAEHIRQLKPKVVTGVANRILKIAELIPDAKSLGISLFTTNSETSSKSQRRKISLKIGVPILDEYSSEEFNIIAWEDKKNRDYIVAEDNVHLELVKSDEGLEMIVATDLWNYGMPRIRYCQNDYSEWKENYPKKGLQRLKRIIGREDMALISPEYGKLDPDDIMEIFEQTLVKEEAKISEFRLIQKELLEVVLLIKRENKTAASDLLLKKFENKFKKIYGLIGNFEIKEVEEFPKLGIKKRCIVREFDV